MKTISLWQPWASLLAAGLKRIETRSWRCPLQLPAVVAIHATKQVRQGTLNALLRTPDGHHYRAALPMLGLPVVEFSDSGIFAASDSLLPHGAVLAIGRLVNCVGTDRVMLVHRGFEIHIPGLAHPTAQEIAFGDYRDGRWAWLFDKILRLPEPIPAKGNRLLWDWAAPPEVETWAAAALAESI